MDWCGGGPKAWGTRVRAKPGAQIPEGNNNLVKMGALPFPEDPWTNLTESSDDPSTIAYCKGN